MSYILKWTISHLEVTVELTCFRDRPSFTTPDPGPHHANLDWQPSAASGSLTNRTYMRRQWLNIIAAFHQASRHYYRELQGLLGYTTTPGALSKDSGKETRRTYIDATPLVT